MGATQRLAVPAPSVSSPSLSDGAQTLCAHAKRRGDDGHALRAFARRASGALYALACVALTAWTASLLWEASSADVLASQPDSPVGRDDASLERWLEAHAVALGGDDARAQERDARTAEGRGKRRFPPDADVFARDGAKKTIVSRAPAPRAQAGSSSPAPPGTLPPLRAPLESVPMYAYRDALADRTSSNVLDVARMAAEDRHAFVRGEFSVGKKEKPRRVETLAGSGAASSLVRVVATHHKTGTALMHDVFSAIARGCSRDDPKTRGRNRTENDTATETSVSAYGAFADVRDMEDHPDAFSARKKARGTNARRAGVVLDYHLGKAVPDFVVDDEIASTRAGVGPTHSFSPDAGLPFALYTQGYRKGPVADIAHDRAFDDFAELPGIVADLLS